MRQAYQQVSNSAGQQFSLRVVRSLVADAAGYGLHGNA
jgi:hypothetical protein